MIQRIQTVYLVLAFICMALLLIFPIFSVDLVSAQTGITITAEFGKDGLVGPGTEAGNMPISYIYISLALLTAFCIFMYKKRKRQLLFTRLNLILHFLFIVGVYVFYFFGQSFVTEALQQSSEYDVEVKFFMEVGFFLLIPTLAFLYLAIRGIKRDENLVSALDRLR